MAEYSPQGNRAPDSRSGLSLTRSCRASGKATVRLDGRLRVDVRSLVSQLERRLNRSAAPPIEVVATGDAISFHACTWQPILLARVEDAMDDVRGSGWRSEFSWA